MIFIALTALHIKWFCSEVAVQAAFTVINTNNLTNNYD